MKITFNFSLTTFLVGLQWDGFDRALTICLGPIAIIMEF